MLNEVRLLALKHWCEKVSGDPELMPENAWGVKVTPENEKEIGPIVKTFCNFAVQRIVFGATGYSALYNRTANSIALWMKESQDWAVVYHEGVKNLALEGELVLAVLEGQPHGHCAVVYPDKFDQFSGKWQIYCPKVANVGKKNGVMGANYAFLEPPLYYRLASKWPNEI